MRPNITVKIRLTGNKCLTMPLAALNDAIRQETCYLATIHNYNIFMICGRVMLIPTQPAASNAQQPASFISLQLFTNQPEIKK